MKITKYALKHKSGNLLSYLTSSNDGGDFCESISYSLHISESDPVWLVDEEIYAQYVKFHSTKWYNAGYNTPSHDFKPEDLTVVKYEQEVTITEVEQEVLPTYLEYLELCKSQNPSEERRYNYLIYQYKEREKIAKKMNNFDILKEFKYSIYDYMKIKKLS